ncbi:MAG TPA: DinB family protein [Terriglobales bacterium]|nr:DinB family protein [Terriglobales bacterium]
MIGRPQASDAAPYYFKYIDQVGAGDAVAVMERQIEEAHRLFSEISEERSLHRYAPGKWSIREVLNHICDAERTFAFRALWFARGFEAPLPSFDQNVAVAAAQADGVPWRAHVEEFQSVRGSTVAFFRNLPEGAWTRSGVASDNRFTVQALAFIIAGHFAHHVQVLRAQYL